MPNTITEDILYKIAMEMFISDIHTTAHELIEQYGYTPSSDDITTVHMYLRDALEERRMKRDMLLKVS